MSAQDDNQRRDPRPVSVKIILGDLIKKFITFPDSLPCHTDAKHGRSSAPAFNESCSGEAPYGTF